MMTGGFPIPVREGRVPLQAPLRYRQARYHRRQQYLQAVVSTRGRGHAAHLRHREPNAAARPLHARLDRLKMHNIGAFCPADRFFDKAAIIMRAGSMDTFAAPVSQPDSLSTAKQIK